MADGWDMITQSAQNDLFSTQEQRDSEKIGKLQEVYINDLIDFKKHTFKVKDDEDMQQLMDSVEKNGILMPGIAFYNEDSQLELVAGHRRKRACELLGKDTLPVLIKTMTRDEAIVVMGETNLQTRNKILPSEKAFTYKEMYDALKRQGKSTDLTSGTGCQKLSAGKEMEKLVQNSERQIRMYIRLTNLIPELLALVDNNRIGIKPGVEISFLSSNLQRCIFNIYESDDKTPSHAQAIRMHKMHNDNLLDEEQINDIMYEIKPNQRETFKISEEILNRYFKNCETKEEIENKIIRAMQLLDKQEKIAGISKKEERER